MNGNNLTSRVTTDYLFVKWKDIPSECLQWLQGGQGGPTFICDLLPPPPSPTPPSPSTHWCRTHSQDGWTSKTQLTKRCCPLLHEANGNKHGEIVGNMFYHSLSIENVVSIIFYFWSMCLSVLHFWLLRAAVCKETMG